MSRAAPLASRVLAAVLVTACNVSACMVGRFLNARYAEEVLWTVAGYRSSSVWLFLLVTNSFLWWWLLTRVGIGRVRWHAAGALLLSVPLGLELGMGIYYRRATGELSVGEALFTRAALALPPGDEQCLPVDLSNPFDWRFAQQHLRPKLLPLPLEDGALKAQLATLACPRSR